MSGAQEEFWNCADIAIVNDSMMDNSVTPEPSYGLTQLITSMFIKTVPNRGKNFQILDSFLTSPNKQLACALRTDERNQMVYMQLQATNIRTGYSYVLSSTIEARP